MALYFVDDPFKKPTSKNKFDTYKKAFFKTDQPDLSILITLMRCYKRFLLTPINLEDLVHGIFGKYLTILLSLACLVYCYFAIRLSYNLVAQSPVTRFLLTALWCVMNMLFVITCFLNSNVFKQENWKAALRCVDQAEYVLRRLNFEVIKKNFRLYLQIICIFVPFFAQSSFQLYLWIRTDYINMVCAFVGSVVTYFYMCLFLLFVLRFTEILRVRYSFVEETLRKTASDKISDEEKRKRLTEIVRLYKTFMVLMDNVNDIIGSHLFFYVCVSISYLLCAFSYNMDVGTDNAHKKMSSVSSILLAITYSVSLIVLIMSCDSVEKSGTKVIKTCYMLHESSESPIVKQHLLQLAQYAEQWRPTLSAAGFYNINQTTLSSIFEALITYLVIIIQFNLALS